MIRKIIAITALLISISSFSQRNNISPYSTFGIGEMYDAKSVAEQSMGGIGTALNSSYRLRFSNPASLGYLKYTTYTLAGANNYTVIDNGNTKQSSSAFSLSYLTLGFPVGKNGGASFGLQPYSKVGYKILDRKVNNSSETETDLYKGKGSNNRIFIGYGYRFPYQISVGIEASYIFGSLERTILHRNESRREERATLYKTTSELNGFSFKIGAQNTLKIKDNINLKTGLTFDLSNKLKNHAIESVISLLNSPNPDIIIPREQLFEKNFNAKVTLPLKTTFSIGTGKENKWYIGYEYSAQKALSFSNTFTQNNNTVNYNSSNNMSFGGFFIPKIESITNYWKRVTYRAGFHIKKTGLVINNTDIKDFGMSFGVSLPSKRKLSNFNFGFDIGKRGEINNNGLIKENYYNFRLSLSLNDKWFNKRKLD